MQLLKTHARFFIAGIALLVAFGLSIQFSDRGWQFDLEKGGQRAMASPDGATAAYNLAGAEILNKVLLQMKEKYVDPTRIDPNLMLVHGLNEVQNSIPEVVIRFDRDIDDKPTTAEIQVNASIQKFRIGKLESLWEMSFKMKEVFRFLQNNLKDSEDLKFNEVEYAAVNGMLHTLDPHSVLLTPKVYKEMQTQTGGKFGGLGIVIGIRDGTLTVIEPMNETPASKAGIKHRDKIVRIEDESTVNMSLSDAVSKLRGEPGTNITIWIKRKGWPTAKPVELTRAIIKIASVESELLSNKVGYVKIKSFQGNTTSGLKKHLGKLSKQAGGLAGLVLDLRDNPGGLLDQAIKVSDTFIETGTIVSTVGYGNKIRDESKATMHNTQPRYPIIVLVDPGSASASEIVAGAIKNHNRGVIIGDTTFGKGSVQVIYEVADGSALKLTIAQYLTPGDISIQSVGIIPDIQIQPVTIDQKGIDLFNSDRITREADLEAHLDHDNIKKGDKPAAIVRFLKERKDPEAEPNDEEVFKEDFAIRFARQLLVASKQVHNRPEMLKTIESKMRALSKQEMERISSELKTLNIDWAEGSSDPDPKLEVTFTSDQAGHTFNAGDTVKLIATATNKGTKPLFRVRAVSKSDNKLLDDQEFIFGKLEPNQPRSWSQIIKIPKHISGRFDIVTLTFGAMNADINTESKLTIETISKNRPHFAFNYALEETKGNGDGILQPGEQVLMNLRVTNNGKGDSGKTMAYLRNLSKAALFLKDGRAEVPSIKAGEAHTFTFSFDVKAVLDKTLKAEIEIYDEVFKEFTSEKIELKAEPDTNARAVSKVDGAITIKTDGLVRNAASADATPLAKVNPGTRLKVTGGFGEMIRVQLGKNLVGWVNKTQGDFNSKGKASADVTFEPIVLRTSPQISMNQLSAITDKAVYKLDGIANDNNAIKDYYIFVNTRQNNKTKTRKIAYKTGGDDMLKLDADIPLKPGMNRIRIFVRDKDDMVSTETVYVYRK